MEKFIIIQINKTKAKGNRRERSGKIISVDDYDAPYQ